MSNRFCALSGFGTKLSKCHACQTLVSSIGIICWPKRPNRSSVETPEIQPPVDRSQRFARRMQENLRKRMAIRPQRAHYRKCARTRRNNKSRACKTTARDIHHTAARTFSFLFASYARSPSRFCIHARLLRGQSRCTTNRTIIRRIHARWLHTQTLDAILHRSGAIQPWTCYQLRRKAKLNQIRICERRHSHLFCCLSSTACTLQTNATVRTTGSVPLRQNSISLAISEQGIPRGLHKSRESHRRQVDDENNQQSRENLPSSRERPQNRSLTPRHTSGAHTESVSPSCQTTGQRNPINVQRPADKPSNKPPVMTGKDRRGMYPKGSCSIHKFSTTHLEKDCQVKLKRDNFVHPVTGARGLTPDKICPLCPLGCHPAELHDDPRYNPPRTRGNSAASKMQQYQRHLSVAKAQMATVQQYRPIPPLPAYMFNSYSSPSMPPTLQSSQQQQKQPPTTMEPPPPRQPQQTQLAQMARTAPQPTP